MHTPKHRASPFINPIVYSPHFADPLGHFLCLASALANTLGKRSERVKNEGLTRATLHCNCLHFRQGRRRRLQRPSSRPSFRGPLSDLEKCVIHWQAILPIRAGESNCMHARHRELTLFIEYHFEIGQLGVGGQFDLYCVIAGIHVFMRSII